MKRTKRRGRKQKPQQGEGILESTRRDFIKLSATGAVAGHVLGNPWPAEAGRITPKANTKKFKGGKYPKGPVMASITSVFETPHNLSVELGEAVSSEEERGSLKPSKIFGIPPEPF